MKKRNPEFEGKLTATVEGNAVLGLSLSTEHVQDMSSVRGLTRLPKLEIINGQAAANNPN